MRRHHHNLQAKILNPSSRFRPCFFSSTSSSSPPSPNRDSAVADESQPAHSSVVGESTSPSPPSFSSYFSDIKERLKSPPSPPRRIPTDPPPPSAFTAAKPAPTASLEEIRRHLAEFRVKSGGASSGSRPSSDTQLSFQDILKSNVLGKPGSGADATGGEASTGLSLESIRESLRKFRASPRDGERHTQSSTFNIKAFQDSLRKGMGGGESGPQLIGTDKPLSIFGKEGIEKKREGETVGPKVRRTEFVKMYGYEELGEKLRKLRPEKDEKTGESFSLIELNDRLAKLRELEEAETESRLGGVSFRDLRESLQRLRDADASKKANMHRLSIFTNLGQATPTFMLKPPQEHLLEEYFHPDHMSSAEKLKLELQSVRDEFKMSENDCGSARVQVAQLTTKIKHLSATLHKKDKHSRKGLQGMVQHRKKLLKYLRRTDWDSYCIVLSKLGLRDVPEYKIPHKSL